ncbi:hypothetical protein COV17_01930 [Candidatus Woesearchaeota archaeon CG10_big_fil_rev_8_21_14_0_10_36_11]|nr:MAG: hypothetical protein COV17_01930 [Candidatus Woesearchaeota archaeon CG10_big_fil_rev_8_21_14_0_10_36_11]
MTQKEIETVIIGGGIAGLGCARKLHENNKDFLLITKDIGGRILMSKKGNVPYGAYFIGSDYYHVGRFLEKTRKLSVFNLRFHYKNRFYMTASCIKYPLQVLKLIRILKKFRKQSRTTSQ